MRRLFVVVVVGFSLLLSASCSYCRRLVVVAVSLLLAAVSLLVATSVSFYASLSFLPAESCCCCWHLVVVRSISLFSLSWASCRHCRWRQHCGILCKSLLYTRLTINSITMEPQHQAQNGLVSVSGVWMLDLVCPSPQGIRKRYTPSV